jgi:DNA polymerase-3 subunit delta'
MAANRLSHALLLQGREGVGKQSFAAWLALRSSSATNPPGSTLRCCGEWPSCALFAAGSHPDLMLVMPEEDKQQISIDQVRAATERLTKTSYRRATKSRSSIRHI